MPSIKSRCVRHRCLRHQLKAAGSSARTTTFACTSYPILLRWALRYMTSTSFLFTALWLKYGPICTLIPCLVRINFGTNSLDCFIVVWLVMLAARPDLCWIITATFDLIVGLKNKGGNSWDRCAPPPLYLRIYSVYCLVLQNVWVGRCTALLKTNIRQQQFWNASSSNTYSLNSYLFQN